MVSQNHKPPREHTVQISKAGATVNFVSLKAMATIIWQLLAGFQGQLQHTTSGCFLWRAMERAQSLLEAVETLLWDGTFVGESIPRRAKRTGGWCWVAEFGDRKSWALFLLFMVVCLLPPLQPAVFVQFSQGRCGART